MNFQPFKFKITGLSPLLVHSPASMERKTTSTKAKTKAEQIISAEEEAMKALYMDEHGNYCFPSLGFRASLIFGGTSRKIGTKSAPGIYSATVQVAGELTVLIDPDTHQPLRDYVIDQRRAVVDSKGIVRARPRFNKWGTELTLLIDLASVTPEVIEDGLITAGTVCGVGDFRVQKKGPFGRYTAELIA